MNTDSEEQEALKDARIGPSIPVNHPSNYQEESVEPTEPLDMPRDVVMTRKRPICLHDTLKDAEGHSTPRGTIKDKKQPQRFSSYMAFMSHIIDSEPSNYEEPAS